MELLKDGVFIAGPEDFKLLLPYQIFALEVGLADQY